MLNFAIIGFGGLGKLHFSGVEELNRRLGNQLNLVALCDIDPEQFTKQTETNLGTGETNLDLSAYRLYTDAKEMLDKEKLDFVITALPTYIHAEIAIMAMDRGIHVFSEKPMALTLPEAEAMIEAKNRNGVKLMIGQVQRYCLNYVLIKEWLDSGKYGKLRRAHFNKISPEVTWSWRNWMLDEKNSGGAALDLHVHDVDSINWTFGAPKAVTAAACDFKTGHETISTIYHYDDGTLITANADWGMPSCYTFEEEFSVRFDKATLVQYPTVLKVYPEDGEPYEYQVPEHLCYVDEVEDFIRCILEDRESEINPPESSLVSLKIALAEKLSARRGSKKIYL